MFFFPVFFQLPYLLVPCFLRRENLAEETTGPFHGNTEDVGAFEFPTAPARETLELALEVGPAPGGPSQRGDGKVDGKWRKIYSAPFWKGIYINIYKYQKTVYDIYIYISYSIWWISWMYMCIEYFSRIKILGAPLVLTPDVFANFRVSIYRSNISLSLSLSPLVRKRSQDAQQVTWAVVLRDSQDC